MPRTQTAILAVTLTLSAADPSLGAWKLNTAESKFSPGPAPRSSTVVYSQDGDWRVTKSEGIDSKGKATTRSNRYKLDGREYPYASSGDPSSKIMVRKIDAYQYEWVIKGKGTALTNGRTIYSKDGKTRTLTMTGVSAKGEKVNNTIVFDKQ